MLWNVANLAKGKFPYKNDGQNNHGSRRSHSNNNITLKSTEKSSAEKES